MEGPCNVKIHKQNNDAAGASSASVYVVGERVKTCRPDHLLGVDCILKCTRNLSSIVGILNGLPYDISPVVFPYHITSMSWDAFAADTAISQLDDKILEITRA